MHLINTDNLSIGCDELEVIKLLIDADFPNKLLLHECLRYNCIDKIYVGENVLDTAIRRECWSIVEYLLSDEERRHIFMSSHKGDKYRDALLNRAIQSLSDDEREEVDKLVRLLRLRKRANSVPDVSIHGDQRSVVDYLCSNEEKTLSSDELDKNQLMFSNSHELSLSDDASDQMAEKVAENS